VGTTAGTQRDGTLPDPVDTSALRAILHALQDVLAAREEVLAADRARLDRFEARHLRRVGGLLARLDALTARLAARRAAEDPGDERLVAEAARAEAAARASAAAADPDPDLGAGPRPGARERPARRPPDEALKQLFRRAARTLHPDLATDPDERARRTDFMARANAAYAAGDRAALQAVLDAFPAGVPADPAEGDADRLLRLIAQVRVRLVAIEAELAALHATGAWRLLEEAEAAEARGVDLLDAVAAAITADIATAEAALRP